MVMNMQIQDFKIPSCAFFIANKSIKDTDYEILLNKYQEEIQKNNISRAKRISQKICILYGMQGLYLYLPIQVNKIQKDKNNSEIVYQDLIQVLGLILYAESRGIINDQFLMQYKQTCLSLCDESSLPAVNSEAEQLSSFYGQVSCT